MKKYFCDVCGSEVDGGLRFAPKPSNRAAEICGLEDLCPSCEKMSRSLDVSALVLAELRFRAGKDETVPVTTPASPSEPTGRGAKEKRAILEAIERFRQERGPGAISELADMVGVYEDEIRDMIISAMTASSGHAELNRAQPLDVAVAQSTSDTKVGTV